MFKKKINLFAILTLFVGMLFAVNTAKAQMGGNSQSQAPSLKGKVIDAQTQQPVPGVELQIKGTDQTTQTNEKGEFSFSGLQPGTYTITAAPEGYKEVTEEIELASSAKEVTIKLAPSGSGG